MEQRFNERRSQTRTWNVVTMQDEIVNKVAASSLLVFDLEDYYPEGIRTQIDISQWLHEGFLLKEKEFREALKNHDWSVYTNHFVAIHCKTEAIIPAWAILLVSSFVVPFAKKVINGNLYELEVSMYQDVINTIDFSVYQHKALILKGCSKKPVPETAYVLAIQKLQLVAKSIMYGEACSAVPIFKRK